MNKTYKIHLLSVMLTMFLAVSVASCGSSKKNTKTAQQNPIEKVVTDQKTHKKLDKTPTAVADALVSEARTWIGTPYKYGGHSRDGADCSGFLMEVFKNAIDVTIPRTTREQRDDCLYVDRDNISVGDILFFSSNNSTGKIAHVGMYVGDGRMIHASSSRGVVEDNLDVNYYVQHFQSIGRVPDLAKANPVPQKVIAVQDKEVIDTVPSAPQPKIPVVFLPAEEKQTQKQAEVKSKEDPATIVKNAFSPLIKK